MRTRRNQKNKIFIGCNYSSKRIKKKFDDLKLTIEKKYPINCIIIDREKNKNAADLWHKIRREIIESSVCFFDVTGNRPNVVLELGFALAKKKITQIYITNYERKNKRKKPDWMLTDISQLRRIPYTSLKMLEELFINQIKQLPVTSSLMVFKSLCKETSNHSAYFREGKKILKELKGKNPKSSELRTIIKGSGCNYSKLLSILIKSKLIRKNKGQNGRIYLLN